MGRIILRGLPYLLCIGLIVVAWFVGARSISLLVDRIHMVEVESKAVNEIGIEDLSGGMLRIDRHPFSLAGPDDRPTRLRMNLTARGELRAEIDGRSIVLGRGADSLGPIRPASGETARFRVERSVLSWPTPLEFNFMTGYAPSWKRNVYYRLSWQKPGGAKLELVWRYEQWFYPGNGWAAGFMTRAGTTGLIRAVVQP